MVTGIDVPILRRDHEVIVAAVGFHELGDALRDGVPALNPEGASFTEGGLHVYNDESFVGTHIV